MALQAQQGPHSPSVLYMGSEHRVHDVFQNGEEHIFPMIVRRGDNTFFQIINDYAIHENVKEILRMTGFMGVIDCGHRNVDRALIHALVERWRPETHTFHLPFGEATVTLQDVNVLLGLPIEGDVVSGIDRKYKTHEKHLLFDLCHDLLGYRPLSSDIKAGRLKMTSLYNQLTLEVNANSFDACIIRARVIIMCLLGGSILPDTTTGYVPLIYLSNLENLSAGLSWGSAALACLYRNLCKAASRDAVEIAGPVYLLQLWAWERIMVVSPRLTGPPNMSHFAYGAR